MNEEWARLDALRRRIVELEERVAALDGRTSSFAAAELAVEPELVNLIRQGNQLEAIKLYRAHTGVGLAEAKAAIDHMAGQI